jgi:integrase
VSTIYRRLKNDAGKWRYEPVRIAPGIRTGDLKPPFYVRRMQQWYKLDADNFADAKKADVEFDAVRAAADRGLTVKEMEDRTNANRKPLKVGVDDFIAMKEAKSPRTIAAYRNDLAEFVESVGVHFLDEVNDNALRKYLRALRSADYAGKTICNRVVNVHSFLKEFKIAARIKKTELPAVEKKDAVPYTDEQVKALLGAMDDELRIRFRFFLGSGCREQEVQYATWNDLDLSAKTFTVSAKPDVGFTPKTHESRTVDLPAPVVEELQTLRKSSSSRWLFPSKQGKPDGHFLRKLKKIAFRAGLNCGHCRTTVNGKEVTCKTHDVCREFKLHRFRKTAATRWQSADIPVRDIQDMLGHASLATTEIYLGRTPSHKLRGKIDRAFGD